MDIKNRIEQIKREGYTLDFSKTLDQALQLFRKIVVPAGLAVSVYLMVVLALLGAYFMNTPEIRNMIEARQPFEITQLSWQSQLTFYVFSIVINGVTMALMAGLMYMCREADLDRLPSVGDAFRYFGGHHLADLFLGAVLVATVSNALTYGLEMIGLSILGMVLALVISLLTSLFVPMVIFGDLPPIASISASIVVVGKQFVNVLGLTVLAYLIMLCGLIACCVGIFFTLSVVVAMQYMIYKTAVGFDPETEND